MIKRSRITWMSLILVTVVFFSVSATAKIQADSVRIERVGENVYILHEVVYGETLFSLSRKYDVSVEKIKQANEVLKQGLKSGQTIRIPKGESNVPTISSAMHKVAYGETLFSISNKYEVSIESLREWNRLSNNSLKAGQELVIKKNSTIQNTFSDSSAPKSPSQTEVAVAESKTVKTSTAGKNEGNSGLELRNGKSEANVQKSTEPVESNASPVDSREWLTHTVQSGETLFSLSNQYGTSLEDLIKWNSLSSNNLKSGQNLKVRMVSENQAIIGLNENTQKAVLFQQTPVENKSDKALGVFKNIRETGLAQVIENTGDHKKYLVLHRTAPIGSVIRVKNEENNVTIFARVVGPLVDTGDNSKLVIMLSQAAVDQLKAINSRFPVEILY